MEKGKTYAERYNVDTEQNGVLQNVRVSSDMRKFAEEYALWIVSVGQRYINALSPDFTTESAMDIFINKYYGKGWMN